MRQNLHNQNRDGGDQPNEYAAHAAKLNNFFENQEVTAAEQVQQQPDIRPLFEAEDNEFDYENYQRYIRPGVHPDY